MNYSEIDMHELVTDSLRKNENDRGFKSKKELRMLIKQNCPNLYEVETETSFLRHRKAWIKKNSN